MNDKATRPRCYTPPVVISTLVIGLLALILSDSQTNAISLTCVFLASSMGDEVKIHSTESGNAFSRMLTGCTSFVRSVTKSETQQAGRKQSTHKTSSSKARSKLQKNVSPTRPNVQTRSQAQRYKMPSTPLFKVIEDGTFWTMPDENLLLLIRDEFPTELDRLKTAYSVRITGITPPSTPSISHILYKKNFDEINRTLVGILALRWIWNDKYEAFIGSHPPSPVTLKRESFTWMRQMFTSGLETPIDIYTLVLSMVTNDLGKDPNLANDYAKLKDIDISKVNHDMILLLALEAGMVPALNLLPSQQRDQLVTGIKLGAEFNFGQLAQGENAPASLSGLLAMRGEERAFEMRFMEQLLDLSGAAGHEDWTCARKMIEPIFQSYRNVYDAAMAIISGEMDLRAGYDIIPARKLELLRKAGWDGEVDMSQPEGRALARLFCMGNTNSQETADMYAQAFTQAIGNRTRKTLVQGFNVDGSVAEPAIQPTYAPAMLSKATGNTEHRSKEEKVQAISAVLGFLARCFEISTAERKRFKAQKVMVIERDVRVIDEIVEGALFKKDGQAALKGCKVPEGVAANIDRTE